MRPIKDAMEALNVALKVVDAQEKLLIAYRIGGRPPGGAIDYLTQHKPRLEAWREAEVGPAATAARIAASVSTERADG